jgi:hypothetical protein
MIHFNFKEFLSDLPISVPALAKKLRIPYRSLCVMKDRGTIKPETYNLLKEKFSKKLVERYRIINTDFKRGVTQNAK